MDFDVTLPVLLVLIFGLVEFVKQLGLTGNRLRLVSMAVGIILAVVFRLRELYPPWSPWIDLFFFGLAAGLTACGIYGFLEARIPKRG
jgi:drug/metabolite transporter (DMT)-like permease